MISSSADRASAKARPGVFRRDSRLLGASRTRSLRETTSRGADRYLKHGELNRDQTTSERIDLKSKKVEQGKLFSPEAKAGLKALTAEDGSETEVRQCRFTDVSNNGFDGLVMAKIRASRQADGFDISVDAKAFTTGKAGKEVASFSGLMKAKETHLDEAG